MAQVVNLNKLRRRLDHLDRDIGYRFKDQDPVMVLMNRVITDSTLSIDQISQRCGVAKSTIRKWQHGDVRRPQNVTVEAVLRALGYHRHIFDHEGNFVE